MRGHSNESYRAVLLYIAVYYAVQCGSNFTHRTVDVAQSVTIQAVLYGDVLM